MKKSKLKKPNKNKIKRKRNPYNNEITFENNDLENMVNSRGGIRK